MSENKENYETKKTIFKTYQTVWYISGFFNTLLIFRFILKLLGANRVGIVDGLYSVTDPLVLPFYGIFRLSSSGRYIVEWTTLVAIAFYLFLTYMIVRLLEIMKPATHKEIEENI